MPTRLTTLLFTLLLLTVFATGCESEPGAVFSVRKSGARTGSSRVTLAGGTSSVAVTVRSPDGQYVVQDGARLGGTFGRVSPPVFSADGTNSAFIGWSGGKPSLVHNGTATPLQYDAAHSLALSPGGDSVAYAARSGRDTFVVRNGRKVGDSFERIDRLDFSPDGGSVVFAASDGRKWFLVRDDVKSANSYDYLWDWTFGPDGSSLYVAVRQGSKLLVVKDGVVQGPGHDATGMSDLRHLVVAPDGDSFAYGVRQDAEYFVVRRTGKTATSERVGDVYSEIGPPVFSPDGSSLAFAAVQPPDSFVIRDSRREATVRGRVGPIAFTPDGSRVVYWARPHRGKWKLVVPGGTTRSGYDSVSAIEPGPDGSGLVTAAVRGGTVSRLTIP
jgi:hypothetical protein